MVASKEVGLGDAIFIEGLTPSSTVVFSLDEVVVGVTLSSSVEVALSLMAVQLVAMKKETTAMDEEFFYDATKAGVYREARKKTKMPWQYRKLSFLQKINVHSLPSNICQTRSRVFRLGILQVYLHK
jgi:hypothetical protein